MINWFRRLIGLCIHSWQDQCVVDVMGDDPTIPIARQMRQRCKSCGHFRNLKMDYL